MVTLDVPVVAVALAVNVSVEFPLPGAASETAALKPPLRVVEMLALPEVPCVTDRLAGDALTAKSAVACFHTSEIGVAVAALPTRVRPYISSSVRRTLK